MYPGAKVMLKEEQRVAINSLTQVVLEAGAIGNVVKSNGEFLFVQFGSGPIVVERTLLPKELKILK